jgi:predicted permease
MSLRRFLHRRYWDEERVREVEAHLAEEIDHNSARGMTPQEARRQAYIKFGNPTVVREEIRQMNSFVLIENLGRDLRYGVRQLFRCRGFAAIAILTLALGIGVNTAIFSITNGLFFSSLHIRDEGRVVEMGFEQKGDSWQPSLSMPEYREVRDGTLNVFSEVIAERIYLDGLSAQGNKPDRVLSSYVTGNYFQMLGVEPFLGRLFRPSEGATPGSDPVMVLSYQYWKEHFAGDPNIIGRQVAVNSYPVTVIGVAPRNFRGLVTAPQVQVYLPAAMIMPIDHEPLATFNKEDSRSKHLFGRLRPGVTRQQADAALALVARRLAVEHPDSEKDAALRSFPLYAGRLGDLDSQSIYMTVSAFFLGLAGLVLLLACVNVANLLLVRASVREREMVIRSALGAQRSRLIRQMMTESLLLALLGGIAGVGLGAWGSSMLSSMNLNIDLPVHFDFGFDAHVLIFSVTVALLAGTVVGIVPAIRLARANLNLILREGGRGVAGGRSRFRDALVIVQVGSALMLLIIAALFTRSLAESAHANLGFNSANVLLLTMDPSEIGYKDVQTRDFYQGLLEHVRALPGVDSATIAGSTPMGYVNSGFDTVTVSGDQPSAGHAAPSLNYNVIGPDYFRTMQISLDEGRGFTDVDKESGPNVGIVSAAMAKKYWPNQDPIGRQFSMSRDPTHPIEVIGVAHDVRYQGFSGPIDPYFYLPFQQHYATNSLNTLEIRTAGDPVEFISEVERSIHNIAPMLPVFEVKTLHESLYSPNGLLIFQVAAGLAGIMGTLGLILAVVGVYGVLSYVVSRRTAEIGIRMALGARRGDILRSVYRQGLWIVGIGLVFGLAGAFAIAHLLGSMIVVSATDPATYLSVSAILAAIAMLACYIPARRAMHVDPMKALRTE